MFGSKVEVVLFSEVEVVVFSSEDSARGSVRFLTGAKTLAVICDVLSSVMLAGASATYCMKIRDMIKIIEIFVAGDLKEINEFLLKINWDLKL
ncbi:MAG: hypothetical protein KAJ20_03485 [Candidatus Aenigmarchaeota archaeon]|nr:hypothetical protein [Candidatus Aenigmarchaeota archaeon]MCK5373374.1 hypothetical protein [Candidatus Aenigmarchaeota archaeon]